MTATDCNSAPQTLSELYEQQAAALNASNLTGDIVVQFRETKTGREVRRRLDVSNLIAHTRRANDIGTRQEQKEAIEWWVLERGYDQHESDLEIIDWTVEIFQGFPQRRNNPLPTLQPFNRARP